jgi:hypothetical protein
MANIFERALDGLAMRIASFMTTPKEKAGMMAVDFYTGNHPPELRVKEGQADDNVTMNWLGLAVDRGVSLLVGAGVEFEFPEESEAQADYINQVWDVNKRGILLHEMVVDGSTLGTVFVKILPDALTDPYTGEAAPRLVLLDPKLMTIETSSRDKSVVEAYIMQFKVIENGKERVFREITRRATPDDYDTAQVEMTTWVIDMQEWVNGWVTIEKYEWAYEFPPILHWKNLPSVHSVYGMSDIEQIVNPQRKYNFVQSNNLKINRYHAHPKTWGAGFTKSDKTSWGADEMITISDVNGKINNLEMSSDLTASRALASELRQSIFDLARQVDISSITDKVGALTNFGIRVLYSDALAKMHTKRELYGDAFQELNRRLLILKGYEGEASFGGVVIFGDSMPVNITEEIEFDQMALELGIVDKQTVSERWAKRYGQDWETIQERLLQQQGQERTLGGLLLRNFNQGQ